MYTAYFGLEEIPFTIAPNPAFLFMSDRHREALAHLTHGLGDNGGFVLLTGEVGTGKTTICRSVMEQLPDSTQAAFILNPTLSSEELLATLCDNLKIRYRKTGATLKYLTDKIQTKLIKNHDNDINTLLIIDEAQHLKPEVLEQLRLLTNLETNTKKLLQVILIGQPELQQLLRRRDLRQLAQRITARYHLLPLTKFEVKQYIQHRLSVALCTRQLFNNGAINAIHRISKGIPRVINLLCDRSLINAYGNNDAVVNKAIVIKSAIDALGDEVESTSTWFSAPWKLAFSLSITITFLAGLLWFSKDYWLPTEQSLTNQNLANQNLAKKNSTIESSADKINIPVGNQQLNDSNNKADALPLTSTAAIDPQAQLLARIAALENKIKKESTEKYSNENNQTKLLTTKPVRQPRVVGYQPEKVIEASSGSNVTATEYKVDAVKGVSNELLARFQSAIDETREMQENEPTYADVNNERLNDNRQNRAEVQSLLDMPVEIQNSVPALQFEQHVFSSDGQGWVRVNGEDKYQGDQITVGLALVDILPQKVILSFRGETFSLPALSSW
jgi:type II secretory pathway predicted ATPase ExeA